MSDRAVVEKTTVTQRELVEESQSITLLKHKWAYEHDTDTETEQGAVVGICEQGKRIQAVADQVDDDPAVAHQVDELQRKMIMKPKPKMKLEPSNGIKRKLYVKRHPLQVFNLTHTKTVFGTASDVRRVPCDKDTIPCRRPLRDISIASFTIGQLCSPDELAKALRDRGFKVIVITFTSELGQFDVIDEAITRWASVAKDPAVADSPAEGAPDFLKDKRVVGLRTQGSMFAALHLDKVRCALFETRALTKREDNAREVHFGTLTVQLHKARADDEFVMIGVINVRHRLTKRR